MNFFVKIKELINSNFFKDITVLTLGTSFAQLIGILASPIISRIYIPDDFGLFGTALAIISILSVSFGVYTPAIVLENNNKKIRELIDLNIYIVFVLSFISSIFFYLLSEYNYFHIDAGIIELFPYIIISVLLIAIYNIYINVLNRDKQYKMMSVFQIIRRFSLSISQIILGIISATVFSLIHGYIFAVLVPILILIFDKKFILFFRSSFNKMKKIALRYYKFPLYTTPQTFINLMTANLPVFVLGSFYSIEIVGLYYFSLKIVQIPSVFIGTSIRQVFYKEAALSKNKINKLLPLFSYLTFSLSFLILLPAIILFFFGGDLFRIVFGDLWIQSGYFASWMFLWYGSNIIAGPSRSLFLVFEKQKLIFKLDIILNVLRVIALFFFSIYYSPIEVVISISLITFLFNIIIIFISFIMLDNLNRDTTY